MSKNDRLAIETSYETPWKFSFAKDEMYRGFGTLSYKVDQLQRLLEKVSDQGCKKVYYGVQTLSMEKILKIVPPRGEDYFIQIDTEKERMGYPCKKFDSLLEETQNIIVIVNLANGGWKIFNKLKEGGFIQGKNLFSAQSLLFGSQGGFVI